jgi:putative ABC transport system ATP-binding protein
LLRRLRDELGKTIVMVTHDINAAAKADQIMHLEKGRLIEQVKQGVAAKC